MKVGEVYHFTNNRIRIIMFDDKEVFYLTVNEDNHFVSAKNKTLIYYRTTKGYFENNAEFIEELALTKKETEIHQPDLPLRLNCFSGLFWQSNPFENEVDFSTFLSVNDIDINNLSGLKSSKIVVFPSSQQQVDKKPVVLENENGKFLGNELLFQCFKIQREYVKPAKPYFSRFRLIPDGREEKRLSGIGIYRLGIKGNLPSYYLGGEMSRMELELEKGRIVGE